MSHLACVEGLVNTYMKDILLTRSGFARKLLGDKRSGMLERPVEEINAHLSNTFSDPSRDVELVNINSLISPEPPSVNLMINLQHGRNFKKWLRQLGQAQLQVRMEFRTRFINDVLAF